MMPPTVTNTSSSPDSASSLVIRGTSVMWAPDKIEIPAELAAALATDPAAKAAFEALAPSHRREYADHVAEAKRPETRERRATQTIERLRG